MVTTTDEPNVILSAQVPRAIRDWLERQAQEEDRSLSSVVRRHLERAREAQRRRRTHEQTHG